MNNRRNFLKTMSALPFVPALGFGNELNSINYNPGSAADVSLPFIGKVPLKTPKDFAKSPFGIGCETLDRELWDPKEIYPWMNDLPVKWARLQTGWARVERVKGRYDWGWLDESVDGLIKRGFKPFFNVGYGNPNYNEGDSARGYHPLVNDETFTAWQKFIKALAQRYKNKIQYYEIWNEPNLKGFWKPGEPDPAKYVKLVRETGKIIRNNCPGAVIIGGVLSRLPINYTKSLFKNGLAKEIDIFSFHPYGVIPESYAAEIKALRRHIDEFDPSIRIWQGEMGYPSDPKSSGFSGEPPWTENIQAKIMLRRLLTDISLGIDMSLWFLIVDIHDYPKGSGRVNYKGILRVKPEIRPKVSFSTLQNLGSIVYGDVTVRNAVIRYTQSDKYTPEEAYRSFGRNSITNTTGNVFTSMLNTCGGKILAYWKVIKAADAFEGKNIDILLWDWEGNGFEEPVLVDLLSGNIYGLKDNFSQFSQAQVMQQLPLQDYPMLITEKNMVK